MKFIKSINIHYDLLAYIYIKKKKSNEYTFDKNVKNVYLKSIHNIKLFTRNQIKITNLNLEYVCDCVTQVYINWGGNSKWFSNIKTKFFDMNYII